MKTPKIFINIAIGIIISIFLLNACTDSVSSYHREQYYYGTILDSGYDPPSAGHKSVQEERYWVVLEDSATKTAIRVHVTVKAYYSLPKGTKTGFWLSKYDKDSYGN